MDLLEEAPTSSILESLDSLKVPLLRSGGAVIFVVIMAVILIAVVKLRRGRAENGPSVIVQNCAVATAPAPKPPRRTNKATTTRKWPLRTSPKSQPPSETLS